ncbi:hypothetical protein VTN31DRAFT_5640 [Thermomyces dupontii]|uniref:uncharacterized protein n=1 Tax=Talaromyces thermophilus TaxID=28565 RepID=UPI003742ED3B
MRTSKLSKDTAKVVQALSLSRRQTRSSSARSALGSFAYSETCSSGAGTSTISNTELSEDDSSSLSSAKTEDIEDILQPPPKKRKSAIETSTGNRPSTRATRKVVVEQETQVVKPNASQSRRQPMRKITAKDGTVKVEPPSNWETMYNIVKKMRENNPTAPVDTMGCAELHWKTSSPRDQRFQTLIALMLSSQTKDTVTAVAMQRLHTELGDLGPEVKKEDGSKTSPEEPRESTLTLENVLAVSHSRLNELIRTVGFHNNKTKYIKQVAEILRDKYDSDIPSSAEELMKLPGVGPKMAYLCMSAAWGKHEGIGVDVHVHRITNLWGWHRTKTPEETRVALESWLPWSKWHEINKLLVGLGQTVCLPVGRRCGECDLAGTGLCKGEIKALVQKKKREESITIETKGQEESKTDIWSKS